MFRGEKLFLLNPRRKFLIKVRSGQVRLGPPELSPTGLMVRLSKAVQNRRTDNVVQRESAPTEGGGVRPRGCPRCSTPTSSRGRASPRCWRARACRSSTWRGLPRLCAVGSGWWLTCPYVPPSSWTNADLATKRVTTMVECRGDLAGGNQACG